MRETLVLLLILLSVQFTKALLRSLQPPQLSPQDVATEPFRLGRELERDYVASGSQTQVNAFQSGLVDAVLMSSNSLINATLAGMDARASTVAQIQDGRRFCQKDYTVVCPDGWQEQSKRGQPLCIAPASYKGTCSTVLVSGADRDGKMKLEESCSVSWPCIDFCKRNYRVLCPKNWEETETRLCRASRGYTDRCERTKDFTHFTQELKEAWSRSCNVLWPCETNCDQDFTAPCPDGWQLITAPATAGVTCASPQSYTGPCGPEEAISHFDPALKRAFATRCNVEFPCIKHELCNRDYRILCPLHWIPLVEDTSCQAPETYKGTCSVRLSPINMTAEDKKAFERTCGVKWPCEEQCVRRYEEPCPEEWKELSTSQRNAEIPHGECVPLATYKGPCRGPKKLWDKSPDMKAAFADNCEAPWACQLSLEVKLHHLKEYPSGPSRTPYSFGVNGPVNPRTGHIIS